MKLIAPVAVAFAAAIALAGCNSGAKSTDSGSNSSSAAIADADPNAIVNVYNSEPQNPLIPTNTNETGGGHVLGMITAGLVYYDPETGAVHNDLAESIQSDDQKVWTVTLRDGIKFSDGSAITSDSFIKAWNYGANPKNAQLSSSFFEVIDGYVVPEDENEVPDVPELSGLAKVDDKTFTITLKSATSDFDLRLGYTAYAPLPEVAFEDMEAYGDNPTVTSGPYKMKDGGWVHNTSIDLVKNDVYDGPRQAKNGGLHFKLYSKIEAAYADLQSGQLDLIDSIPSSSLANYQTDFPNSSVSQPASTFYSFTIPSNLEHFKNDEEGNLRRQAISMAIDREELVKVLFYGTREPATDFTSPTLANHSAVQKLITKADVLKHDPETAKELWQKADAISPFTGKLTLAYNADASHKDWVDAVMNQVSNALGIQAEGNPYADFKSLRNDVVNRQLNGAFRTGWQADYPSMTNFLEPLYATGASSNDGDYSNPEFDSLLDQIRTSGSEDERNKLFAQAEDILLTDLPAIPLYYGATSAAWNESNVGSVTYGWDGTPAYYLVTKAAS